MFDDKLKEDIKRLDTRYYEGLTTIKKFTENNYKLVTMTGRTLKKGQKRIALPKKNTINVNKLDNNLVRAKTTIRELSMCNVFKYFCTFTLDKKKYNRKALDVFIKDFGQFIRDYRKKYNCNLQYILIPESHKDGAWHMHGLFKNIDTKHLVPFKDFPQKTKIPDKLRNSDYMDFPLYSQKFGFCSLGEIHNTQKTANYITKYVNKDLGNNLGLSKKSYYTSRGLKKPETIKKGFLANPLDIEYDFENDYCKIKNLQSIASVEMQLIID